MVVGLDIFREYFKDYQDCYLLIGGTACDIILEDAGFIPRATDDIDIILIIEALSPEFFIKFWEFIKEGDYQEKQKEQEKRNCYRFRDPMNKDFPKQIELFCRVPDIVEIEEGAHLTPIPAEEGLSSLSAILLDEEYYKFTLQNSESNDGIHLARPHTLICLKSLAFLKNKELREAGHPVSEKNILKHKYDVIRLVLLLSPADSFELPGSVKGTLQEFVDAIKDDLPDPAILKKNGFGDQDMQVVFNQLLKSFNLTA